MLSFLFLRAKIKGKIITKGTDFCQAWRRGKSFKDSSTTLIIKGITLNLNLSIDLLFKLLVQAPSVVIRFIRAIYFSLCYVVDKLEILS